MEQSSEEDRLEAASSYQALGVQVLLLSSGRWVVVSRGPSFAFMERLDEERVRELCEVERAGWEERKEWRKEERIALSQAVLSVDDMGL